VRGQFTSPKGHRSEGSQGLGFRDMVRVSACYDCQMNHHFRPSCDNVHLIVTLDVNVGPVTLRTSDL